MRVVSEGQVRSSQYCYTIDLFPKKSKKTFNVGDDFSFWACMISV